MLTWLETRLPYAHGMGSLSNWIRHPSTGSQSVKMVSSVLHSEMRLRQWNNDMSMSEACVTNPGWWEFVFQAVYSFMVTTSLSYAKLVFPNHSLKRRTMPSHITFYERLRLWMNGWQGTPEVSITSDTHIKTVPAGEKRDQLVGKYFYDMRSDTIPWGKC